MNIPSPSKTFFKSLWPQNRLGVIEVAQSWYNPDRVKINEKVVASLPVGTISKPESTFVQSELTPQTPLKESMMFSMAMNSINYRFWDKTEEGEFIRYGQNGKIGAMAMTEAFKTHWLDPRSPLFEARMSHRPLTLDDIHTIFGDIPKPESRQIILNEVLLSEALEDLGQLGEKIAQQQTRDQFDTNLAAQLAQAFPQAYGDGVLKKAQLAVSFMWREAQARGYHGDCPVTAFADYQIPNVMRALHLLEYAPDLAQHIDDQRLLPAEGQDERALRGAAILAVEQLAQHQGVGVADVDFWIWLKRKEPQTPFHLTDTTAY